MLDITKAILGVILGLGPSFICCSLAPSVAKEPLGSKLAIVAILVDLEVLLQMLTSCLVAHDLEVQR